MIGDLIAAYTSWLSVGVIVCLALVGGWNSFKAMV